MTEQAVQDPVPRIAQMEAHLNTASQAIQAIRDATERATAAENRARGAEQQLQELQEKQEFVQELCQLHW